MPPWPRASGPAPSGLGVVAQRPSAAGARGAAVRGAGLRGAAGAADRSVTPTTTSRPGSMRPRRRPACCSIGLGHGSVQGILAEGIDSANPLAPDRAASARLDYLALGDRHAFKRIDARTWYAGTPEPDRFKANDAGPGAAGGDRRAGRPAAGHAAGGRPVPLASAGDPAACRERSRRPAGRTGRARRAGRGRPAGQGAHRPGGPGSGCRPRSAAPRRGRATCRPTCRPCSWCRPTRTSPACRPTATWAR